MCTTRVTLSPGIGPLDHGQVTILPRGSMMGNGEMKLDSGCCVCKTEIVIYCRTVSIPRWGMGNGEMKLEPGCCVCKTDIVICLQYSTVQYSTVQYSTVQYSSGDRIHLRAEHQSLTTGGQN
jgi:hypothetical protein